MKRIIILCALLTCTAYAKTPPPPLGLPGEPTCVVTSAVVTFTTAAPEVHFSPKGGCTAMVVREIGKAQHELLVESYQMTSWPIVSAIIDAYKRGADVRVILDHLQEHTKSSLLPALREAGVNVRLDREHKIFHHKVAVIDKQTVLTGSFNMTVNAEESNAENCIALNDKGLAALYREDMEKHWGHSKP